MNDYEHQNGSSGEDFEKMRSLMNEIDAQDIVWLDPWTALQIDNERTDWLHIGREKTTDRPGFAQIIFYKDRENKLEFYSWTPFAGEEEMEAARRSLKKNI